jgi:UPF0755 protein
LIIIAVVIMMGVLFVLSGGNIGDFVQDTLVSFRLSGREDDLNSAYSSDTTPILITIASGDSPRAIAEKLRAAQLIRDVDLFVDYVQVNDFDTRLRSGDYYLYRTQTTAEIAQTLVDPNSTLIVFTILPGMRIEEIADIITRDPRIPFSGADFLASVGAGAALDPAFAGFVGLPAGASLEGFLFPATYQLPLNVTALMLRDLLTQRFITEVNNQMIADAATQDWSLYQVVTLASIVERESLRPEEDARIASVYRNRLDIAMLLQADPTVQYGLNNTRGSWWAQITQSDYVNVNSTYNTYLYSGLPPGPIASPSLSAIRAVIYPEDTDYIFFRARCDGSGLHEFAITFEEHEANACSS